MGRRRNNEPQRDDDTRSEIDREQRVLLAALRAAVSAAEVSPAHAVVPIDAWSPVTTSLERLAALAGEGLEP